MIPSKEKLKTAAGIKLIMTENDMMGGEIKVIIQILHKYFTDKPGEVIDEFVEDIKGFPQSIF
jgi:hypothetical protein